MRNDNQHQSNMSIVDTATDYQQGPTDVLLKSQQQQPQPCSWNHYSEKMPKMPCLLNIVELQFWRSGFRRSDLDPNQTTAS